MQMNLWLSNNIGTVVENVGKNTPHNPKTNKTTKNSTTTPFKISKFSIIDVSSF